jgi:hypothetical protein
MLNNAVRDVDDVMRVELEQADFRRPAPAPDSQAGAVAETCQLA